MNMKTPEIRINFSELLYDFASREFAKNMDEQLYPREDCYEWTDNYRNEWEKYETKLVPAMSEALGVEFYKSTIDVSVAPFFVPQSDPLIISFAYLPDQFVDVLAHELIHVLLTDNNKVRIRDIKPALNLVDEWQQLFGKDHDFNTLVHIPVHAVLKHLYLDVLQEPERLERDMQHSVGEERDNQPYVNAWQYVAENDYKDIISKLEHSYARV